MLTGLFVVPLIIMLIAYTKVFFIIKNRPKLISCRQVSNVSEHDHFNNKKSALKDLKVKLAATSLFNLSRKRLAKNESVSTEITTASIKVANPSLRSTVKQTSRGRLIPKSQNSRRCLYSTRKAFSTTLLILGKHVCYSDFPVIISECTKQKSSQYFTFSLMTLVSANLNFQSPTLNVT